MAATSSKLYLLIYSTQIKYAHTHTNFLLQEADIDKTIESNSIDKTIYADQLI